MTAGFLCESLLYFFMNKMTANNRWYPFKQQIIRRELTYNLNFGDLHMQLPLISQAFGFYKKIEFSFNDTTLQELLNELKMWDKERTYKTPKAELKFTRESLQDVSLNMMVLFIHDFPENLFRLNIKGIDWA